MVKSLHVGISPLLAHSMECICCFSVKLASLFKLCLLLVILLLQALPRLVILLRLLKPHLQAEEIALRLMFVLIVQSLG